MLKDTIRTKVCGIGRAGGFSQTAFIRWAKVVDKRLLLTLLAEVQGELEEEAAQFLAIAELVGSGASLHYQLRQNGSENCAALLRYYREVLPFKDRCSAT